MEEGLKDSFRRLLRAAGPGFRRSGGNPGAFAGLSERYGYAVAPAEHVLTRSADTLIERRRVGLALEILEYQTSLYPRMVNGWWRLAGLAAGRGDTDRAIELYRKCVEIDPGMKNFVERRINSLQAEK